MEHKIGTRITLEVVDGYGKICDGCYFDRGDDCIRPKGWQCVGLFRSDHKNIIYKEIK